MKSTIYDANAARPSRRFSVLLTLALGIGLSAWYFRDIGKTVIGDTHTFSSSFRTLPILTLVLALFKLLAYLVFGALFAIMIYVPVRNLWFNKCLTGRIESVEESSKPGNGTYVLVKLDGQIFTFRDPGGLKDSLRERTSLGDSVRFTIGAFGRVERVEKLN